VGRIRLTIQRKGMEADERNERRGCSRRSSSNPDDKKMIMINNGDNNDDDDQFEMCAVLHSWQRNFYARKILKALPWDLFYLVKRIFLLKIKGRDPLSHLRSLSFRNTCNPPPSQMGRRRNCAVTETLREESEKLLITFISADLKLLLCVTLKKFI
jgi:hypothetical protein